MCLSYTTEIITTASSLACLPLTFHFSNLSPTLQSTKDLIVPYHHSEFFEVILLPTGWRPNSQRCLWMLTQSDPNLTLSISNPNPLLCWLVLSSGLLGIFWRIPALCLTEDSQARQWLLLKAHFWVFHHWPSFATTKEWRPFTQELIGHLKDFEHDSSKTPGPLSLYLHRKTRS